MVGRGERVAAVGEAVGDEEQGGVGGLGGEELLGGEQGAEGVGGAAGVADGGEQGVEEVALVGVVVDAGVVAEDDEGDVGGGWGEGEAGEEFADEVGLEVEVVAADAGGAVEEEEQVEVGEGLEVVDLGAEAVALVWVAQGGAREDEEDKSMRGHGDRMVTERAGIFLVRRRLAGVGLFVCVAGCGLRGGGLGECF